MEICGKHLKGLCEQFVIVREFVNWRPRGGAWMCNWDHVYTGTSTSTACTGCVGSCVHRQAPQAEEAASHRAGISGNASMQGGKNKAYMYRAGGVQLQEEFLEMHLCKKGEKVRGGKTKCA